MAEMVVQGAVVEFTLNGGLSFVPGPKLDITLDSVQINLLLVGEQKVAMADDIIALGEMMKGEKYIAPLFKATPGTCDAGVLTVSNLSTKVSINNSHAVSSDSKGDFTAVVSIEALNANGNAKPQEEITGKWKIKDPGQKTLRDTA